MWLFLVFCACTLVVLASLLGGWLPTMMRLTHTGMQLTMSFVGGLMLGVAVLHMLPHSLAAGTGIDGAVVSLLVGILTMFILIRIFGVHQHGHLDARIREPRSESASEHHGEHEPADTSSAHEHAAEHEHSSHCSHDHHGEADVGWLGLFLGLSLHTLIDGVALAASLGSERDAGQAIVAATGTFLVILLHKPLDSLSLSAVMLARGWSARQIAWVNGVFSLMCPLGVWLFFQLESVLPWMMVGHALAFSAGVFLCISLADILPELQFHAHDKLKLAAALMVGVGLAGAIGWLEDDHAHDSHDHVEQRE